MPSTNSNKSYFRSGFMNKINYTDPHSPVLRQIEELDPLSSDIHEFISSLYIFIDYEYMGEQLTNICYRYHETTSTVWIVLMVNGLLSRTELRTGMILKIPTLENLLYVINQRRIRTVTNVNAFGTRILT